MKPQIIPTKCGTLLLQPATDHVLTSLKRWPEGIRTDPDAENPRAQIILHDGHGDVNGLKFALCGTDTEAAILRMFKLARGIVPFAVAAYLANGFNGILLPSVYLKASEHYFETGCVLFGKSFEKSAAGLYSNKAIEGYEELFGVGGTNMFFTFLSCMLSACVAVGWKNVRVCDLDFETRPYLRATAFDLIVVGPHVICLKPDVRSDDDIWAILVNAGIDELFHLPVVTE